MKKLYISDMDEAYEIDKTYPDIQFILKPLQGSGGYDINLLENNKNIQLNEGEFILQEYVNGISLSSSLLATKSDAKTIMNTRLLTAHDFGITNSFVYIGNILPLTSKSILSEVENTNEMNDNMNNITEKLANNFNLIGSNGVDYILNENGLYVIEINPRLQGTFECAELSLGINMLDAHIMACRGEMTQIPQPKCYAYKKIIYSPARMKYQKIDLDNIYDLPHIGSITEKSEPLLTIIDEDKDLKKLCEKVESASKTVNNEVRKHQVSEQ